MSLLVLAQESLPSRPAYDARDIVVLVLIGVVITALWLFFRRMFDEKRGKGGGGGSGGQVP